MAYYYLSMLGLKLIHVSKRGPSSQRFLPQVGVLTHCTKWYPVATISLQLCVHWKYCCYQTVSTSDRHHAKTATKQWKWHTSLNFRNCGLKIVNTVQIWLPKTRYRFEVFLRNRYFSGFAIEYAVKQKTHTLHKKSWLVQDTLIFFLTCDSEISKKRKCIPVASKLSPWGAVVSRPKRNDCEVRCGARWHGSVLCLMRNLNLGPFQ